MKALSIRAAVGLAVLILGAGYVVHAQTTPTTRISGQSIDPKALRPSAPPSALIFESVAPQRMRVRLKTSVNDQTLQTWSEVDMVLESSGFKVGRDATATTVESADEVTVWRSNNPANPAPEGVYSGFSMRVLDDGRVYYKGSPRK